MKLHAVSMILALAGLGSQLAGADAGSNVAGQQQLMSKRASDAVLQAHQMRRRAANGSSTKAKRGKCPVRGKPVQNNNAEQPSSSISSISSSSKVQDKPEPTPSTSSTKKDEPKETPKPVEKPPQQPQPEPQPEPEQPKPEPPKESPKPQPQQPSGNSADAVLGGIGKYWGKQSGIGSWFYTHKSSDSTNGRSWCETQYQDDWRCAAVSVGTMISDKGGDVQAAKKAYCGREIKMTNPENGKTIIGFICDGFDDRWVLSPASLDLTVSAYQDLKGYYPTSKNDVIKNLQWEWTGGYVSKGTRKSPESQGNTNY